MSEPEVLTTEDLRNRMFEVLKKRGLVDVLKVSGENGMTSISATNLIGHDHIGTCETISATEMSISATDQSGQIHIGHRSETSNVLYHCHAFLRYSSVYKAKQSKVV